MNNNNILPTILSTIAAAGLVSCAPPPSTVYSGAKSGIPTVPANQSGTTHDWGPFGTGERRDRVLLVPYGDPHRRGIPGDRDRVLLREDGSRSGGAAELREVETLRRE